ncbi:Uncharacterized conserved protein [Phaffia rhodozyma]|uniref:Autophagy-related protein 101 n=1 Tax=Phaffia rhodozyma TaxID=264483 RepID=A0A0F7SN69_PHARH|nr:Uncharacterized conserved protein [Phaffia rhodozyma]
MNDRNNGKDEDEAEAVHPTACQTFESSFTVERTQVKDVLRALLLAILFQRTYSTVSPTTLDVLGITFSIPNDPELAKTVTDRVDAFWRTIGSVRNWNGQISLIFSEKRPKKTWFAKGEEDVAWEKWILNVQVQTGQSERQRTSISTDYTQPALQALLLKMLRFVNKYKDHVPLITESSSTDGAGGTKPSWSWAIIFGSGG